MIVISASARMKSSKQELKTCLGRLNEIYPRYSPEEHLRCDYVRGDPLHEGSILYFEERLAGKIHHMRYRVASVIEDDRSLTAVFRAMFPRSLLNISAAFSVVEDSEGVELSRTLKAGFEHPILGGWMDGLIHWALGKGYVEEMSEHSREDIGKLAEYIARNMLASDHRRWTIDNRPSCK